MRIPPPHPGKKYVLRARCFFAGMGKNYLPKFLHQIYLHQFRLQKRNFEFGIISVHGPFQK
jgi:hypothetical protein